MGVMLQKLNYSQKCFWPFCRPAGGGTSRRTSGQPKCGSAKMKGWGISFMDLRVPSHSVIYGEGGR